MLLVSEGSGGHLIPAIEVAAALARSGHRVKVWYAARRQTEPLVRTLAQDVQDAQVEMEPLPVRPTTNPLGRLRQCAHLWRLAQRSFDVFDPDVVVGFGGWVSAPIVLAASRRRIGCLVHEQNVVMGRANRWLSRWVDSVAVSFEQTQTDVNGHRWVVTGMPVRKAIGDASSSSLRERLGFAGDRPTLLILGGSQGSRFLNTRLAELAARLSPSERSTWQFLHITGTADEANVRTAYDRAQARAWVTPFLAEMEAAYALADLVIARAGASTIAELARCGKPCLVIPYPFAGGHQRANAQLVDGVGGGVVIEESEATVERLLGVLRQVMSDERLRRIMGQQMRTLDVSDATERLASAIAALPEGSS